MSRYQPNMWRREKYGCESRRRAYGNWPGWHAGPPEKWPGTFDDVTATTAPVKCRTPKRKWKPEGGAATAHQIEMWSAGAERDLGGFDGVI